MIFSYILSCSTSLPFLLVSTLLICLFVTQNMKRAKKGNNPPPSPPGLPIIGNLHQLGKLKHQCLWKLSQQYGPVMQLQLGNVPTLVISSAAMAREVLKVHDLDCCTRPNTMRGPNKFSYDCLDIVFSSCNESWRELRKTLVYQLMSCKKVDALMLARDKQIKILMDSLNQASSNNNNDEVDLSELVFAFMDGFINTFAFGKCYGGKQFKNLKFKDVVDEVLVLMDAFSADDFFPWVGWIVDIFTGFHARLNKCFHNLDAYFQMVIDDHLDPLRPKPDAEDLVDALIRLSKNQTTGACLTNGHIKGAIMDTFIAGTDTSAITIIWAMAELIKHPRIMAKVQAEVRGVTLEKPLLEEVDVENFNYLKMVVKETFRLHPPTRLLIPRETIRHFQINTGGDNNEVYDIEPKVRILVNAWAIHRDEKVWENADDFYPERFENSGIDVKGQHFQFLPFGAGRRMCPAISMGMTTVEVTLANLLNHFDWQLPKGMDKDDLDMEEDGGITIHKKIPLRLVPIKK